MKLWLMGGYSSESGESTRRELSSEYQHDRVLMVFKTLCIFMLWTKITLALEGLVGLISPYIIYTSLMLNNLSGNKSTCQCQTLSKITA